MTAAAAEESRVRAARGMAAHLRAVIARDGPIPVERYMAEALGHAEFGYYGGRHAGDPLGARGDFVTAPEVSQMFGELIGLWCAVGWAGMGRPAPVRLVELGPGRGTLMADALRALGRTAPDFLAAAELHLIETSPALRRQQGALLADSGAVWHEAFAEVPEGPLLLIANEFFDALPIRQFVCTEAGWRERLVDAAEDGFRFVLAAAAADPPLADAALGSIFEDCPAGRALVTRIGKRLAAQGGLALIVDYGHAASAPGETLQAVRRHRPHQVLAAPGSADITAHVDFAALARAARAIGARVYGPVPQGRFLEGLGIRERAQTLSRTAAPRKADEIRAASRRLINADEMGSLFKVLALAGADQPAPPGFEWTPAPPK